jgi:NAD(P)-dependent dehydrogenase (short-subunit alcohol dehydrogenase family)
MGLGSAVGMSALVVAGMAIYFATDPIRFTRNMTTHTAGVVVISGSSSGIGLDLAKALVSAEHFVVIAGVRDLDCKGAKELATVGAIPVLLDVRDDAQIEAAVELATTTAADLGVEFMGLVNNAGLGHDLPIEYLTREQITFVYDVNVVGTMRLTAAALPALRASKGRVISVGSVGGRVAAPGLQPYVGTKAALESFSDSLRREVGPLGVSVSQVDPGCIDTNFFDAHFKEKDNMKRLSKERYAVYSGWLDKREDTLTRCANTAEPTATSTTPALIHALTSPHPRTRYYPGSWNYIPASVLVFQAWILPDLIQDALMAAPIPGWM